MKVIVIDDAGVQHERVRGDMVCLHCSLRSTCVGKRGMMCMFAGDDDVKYYYEKVKS